MECTATNSETSQGIVLMAADVEDVNGQTYFLNLTDSEEFTLTLSGPKDLDCFAVGDVVQRTTAGNIIATTDAGDFFTDPDIVAGFGDVDAVFAPTLNPGYTLIRRDNAWEEFTFLNPPTVTTNVQFRGGNYSVGDRNFALYLNGQSMINPAYGVNEWDSPGDYGTPAVVAFSGVLNTFRIEAVNGNPGNDGVGVSDICVDAFDAASKITGTPTALEEVKIISIPDPQTDPPTIVVDGGDWTGSDGSGTPGEQTTLSKQVPYDTKLTVAGPTDLADMTGGTFMSDGAGAPGPYTQTPYKLVTTDIESVNDTDPANVVLTFPGAVSTNPDLQYFKAGDLVQGSVKGVEYGVFIGTQAPGVGLFNILRPTTLSYSETTLGDVPDDLLGKRGHDIYAYFSSPTAPIFTRLVSGTGTSGKHWLCYWNGSSWIVDDSSGGLNNSSEDTSLVGSSAHQYWVAFRSNTVYTIGQSINVGTEINNDVGSFLIDNFSYDAAFNSVKVVSTGYPTSNTMVVDGGEWLGSNNQIWSSGLSYVGDLYAFGGEKPFVKENAFDGSFSYLCNSCFHNWHNNEFYYFNR